MVALYRTDAPQFMRKNRRNYYRILHVQPDAPTEIIKASYRTLMQKLHYHPDLGGDDWNAAILNEALAVLTDAERRAAYDASFINSTAGRQYRGKGKQARAGTHATEEAGHQPYSRPSQQQTRVKAGKYRSGPIIKCHFCGTLGNVMSTCSHCYSPLQPPPPSGKGASEQRAFKRLHFQGDARVFVHWPQEQGYCAVIHDLTPHGMQIHLDRPLDIDQIIKISSDFLGSISRVVNCAPDKQGQGYLIGLAFLSLCFHRPRGGFVSDRA